VSIRVVHGKATHYIDVGTVDTVGTVKEKIAALTNVPSVSQKLSLKGKALKDDALNFNTTYTLGKKDKLILIGTPIAEALMAVTKPSDVKPPPDEPVVKEEPLQEVTKHKKILDKGLPPDAEVGNAMDTMPLPEGGLKGIYDTMGNIVRLTFKFEAPAVIEIKSKERTTKFPMGSVRDVTSQKIEGRGGYHIVTLKMGSKDDKSAYYLYYVPAQYVEALKQTIMGGGGFF